MCVCVCVCPHSPFGCGQLLMRCPLGALGLAAGRLGHNPVSVRMCVRVCVRVCVCVCVRLGV